MSLTAHSSSFLSLLITNRSLADQDRKVALVLGAHAPSLKPNQDYLCTESYSNSARVAYGLAYLSQDNEVESTCGFSWEARCMLLRTRFTQLVRAQLSRILVVRDQNGQQFSILDLMAFFARSEVGSHMLSGRGRSSSSPCSHASLWLQDSVSRLK
ncbi:hypothetical protein CMV_024020 [Castanea mollissima]|uniref:Uncharacterized protein n=1 Tax=Castanea mollissima TaxID=60419 RepID=A0A8J4QPE9_9ROSI|nr:hypothetical protein CMV_024020 [Castanea mollissima]